MVEIGIRLVDREPGDIPISGEFFLQQTSDDITFPVFSFQLVPTMCYSVSRGQAGYPFIQDQEYIHDQ
jgi:hypothetical protein